MWWNHLYSKDTAKTRERRASPPKTEFADVRPTRTATVSAQRRLRAGYFRHAVRRFLGLVGEYQWWILGVAAVAVLILGTTGAWEMLVEKYPEEHKNLSDAIYISVKDFELENHEAAGLPWKLELARYLAPAVAGWATISALGLLFRDRVQQLKIPWMRGHVVICGLGEYVGITFLRHLREARIPAVVVELNPDNPGIELCRSLGVPVIVGDAQRLKTLQAAGAHRARRVLAVAASDAVNTQIVATWRELPGRRSNRLGCLGRITDSDYCSLLRIQEAQRGEESTVDFFNIDEISARIMLKQFPFETDCARPHILVAHLDPLGIWLVYHAARTWHDNRRDGDDTPLMVTVLDHDPEESVRVLKSQHPQLKKLCDFHLFRATAEDIAESLPDHHLDSATPHISRAYVTAYEDQQAFQTGLKLHHGMHKLDPPVRVAVALAHPHGVSGLLADVKKAGALANVDVFPTMERACSVALVWGGSFEPLAEAIHDRWRAEQLEAGKPAPSWDELDEALKESNRAQARAIASKLDSIDCAVAPLQNWDSTKDFKFSDEELEKLAIDEHNRWWHERLDAGWKLIPMPNAEDPDEVMRLLEQARSRKEHPCLVPWADLLALDAEMDRRFGDRMARFAEYDRIAVREIPERLAAVGLNVIRMGTTAGMASAQTPTAG
jgi:voltage-gated potassium channel Kch